MMIACTGNPEFGEGGETTILTIPSGKGEPFEIALTRNQLCRLMQRSRWAVNQAFEKPQPELERPVLIRSGKGA